uniref:Uncharacterized protein n=1 Tax=Paramormyrops kingsleyae TaxID=1676925 RepID=A0A3B3RF47_9TELE
MLREVCLVAGILGLVGVIIVTALPNWKVTAYIGADIIVMETLWEGLWMNCQKQSIFRIQCKVYDSVLILPPDMQAARGLMCCSIILALFAVLMSGCGMQSSNCCQEDPRKKSHVVLVGGCIFLLSGLTTLIPICWTANTIIRDFYNPLLVDAQKRELGEALYTGWATAGLLFPCPSIHFLPLIRGRVAGAAVSAGKPRLPSPRPLPPAPLGESRGVPRPAERHSPSSVSWVFPGASSQWDMPGPPYQGGAQEAS